MGSKNAAVETSLQCKFGRIILYCLSLVSCLHSVSYLKTKDFFSNTSNLDIISGQNELTSIQQETKVQNNTQQCWRQCPIPRQNHIVVNFPGSAGLSDRMAMINRLGNIAGYLCANLHVPAPNEFLSRKHNAGNRLSTDVQWSDFNNWTWAMEELQNIPLVYNMYITKKDIAFVNKTTLLYPLHDVRGSWYSVSPINQMRSYHIVAKQRRGWKEFIELEQFVQHQLNYTTSEGTYMGYSSRNTHHNSKASENNGFLWEISINPYDSGVVGTDTPFLPKDIKRSFEVSFPSIVGYKGCEYILKRPSTYVQDVVDRVWKEVYNPDTTMGFLHIRRGDALRECDTTIKKMRSYFNCTFAKTRRFGSITMLLATDETDPSYLWKLQSLLQNMYPHVKLIHLDPIVEKQIKKYVIDEKALQRLVNNLFIFKVTNQIRQNYAVFALEQRRFQSCKPCDYLFSWEKVEWVGSNKSRN